IKVIKKADLKGIDKTIEPRQIKTAEQKDEKIAAHISQWIRDFEKQRRGAKRAAEKFFIPPVGKPD
ncbi:hypothetical protein, partial [Acinetobacter sp. NIOH-H-8]|uniref:hypothetical protein n=1 Tax=Acinetobacter sp. NIOH-H-8 TaxID=3342120 RepID=UPI0039882F54